jgi:hypothetical protein
MSIVSSRRFDGGNQAFRGTYRLHAQDGDMLLSNFDETYKTTRRHNSEEHSDTKMSVTTGSLRAYIDPRTC